MPTAFMASLMQVLWVLSFNSAHLTSSSDDSPRIAHLLTVVRVVVLSFLTSYHRPGLEGLGNPDVYGRIHQCVLGSAV
jgi:hypothetical protein